MRFVVTQICQRVPNTAYRLFPCKKHITRKFSYVSIAVGKKHAQSRPLSGKTFKCQVRFSSDNRFPLLDHVLNYKFTNYEHEKRTFQLEVPEFYNWAQDVIDVWADAEQRGIRDTSLPALWWIDEEGNEQKLSFQQLSDYSKRVANILTGPCKLGHGDRAIVILPRVIPWWLINIAACRAGIVLSPGTTLLRSTDIKYRIQVAQAKCILTDVPTSEHVDKISKECPNLLTKVLISDSDKIKRPGWLSFNELLEKADTEFQTVSTKSSDPLQLYFTSGTTGSPKMAEHTHGSYGLGHLLSAKFGFRINKENVFWNWSDTGWAKSAWSNLFGPWMVGSCIFQLNAAKFEPTKMLQVLQKFPVNVLCVPPTALRFIVKEPLKSYQFSALRYVISGGEPVNPELITEWEDGTGIPLYEVYGQTETTFICGNYPGLKYVPGSMGKSSPGVDLQVVDDNGNIMPRGEEGHLAVRCKPKRPVGLFTRYLDDPARTESVHVGDFYLTGDQAFMDEEDYIHFVGRQDDVITAGGYRIGPFEVESALIEHPAVLESAVVSGPDETRGEVVKAFVVLTQGYKDADKDSLAQELQNHVKEVTAPYKYPRKIVFVDDLPKTVSGKIRRIELRNKAWGRTTEG